MARKQVHPVVTVHALSAHGAAAAALELADLVEARPDVVLGLATGNTMVDVYAALVHQVRERKIDTSRLRTFNLDEFVGLESEDRRSFRSFMEQHLHGPLGIDEARALFPDERLAVTDAAEAARRFEDAIQAAGGLDLQLLGLGRNGHIAFNEPGSSPSSRTRIVELHGVTRADASGAFGGLEHTPTHAVTMGIGTILEARALRVLAFGAAKADAVRHLLEGEEDSALPCTYLRRRHSDLVVHVDRDAAQQLTGQQPS